MLYCLLAWLVGIATIPQAGGNINYFWEPLMASAVLSAPGLCELQRQAGRRPLVASALLLAIFFGSFLPMLRSGFSFLRQCYWNTISYPARRMQWEAFISTISGRRLLSTEPAVAVQSSLVELPEPYYTSVLELRGVWNPAPVVTGIESGVYELMVVHLGEAEDRHGHRGVRFWGERIWNAMKRNYRKACVFENLEVWLPRRGSGDFLPKLAAVGCQVVPPQAAWDAAGPAE